MQQSGLVRRCRQIPQRLRRGFILVMALSLLFVMLVLALGLSTMEQSHHLMVMQTEYGNAELEASENGFAVMQNILTPQGMFPEYMGLPSAMPVLDSGEPQAAFHQPPPAIPPATLPVALSGYFTSDRTDPLGSLLRTYIPDQVPICSTSGELQDEGSIPVPDPLRDGYGDVAGDRNGMGVSPLHTRVLMTASLEGGPSRQYFSIYSQTYPFGVVAVQGNISLADAFSVADDNTQLTGLPVNLWAGGTITVSGYLNGRALTAGPSRNVSLGTASGLGQGGLVVANQTSPPGVPIDFQPLTLTSAQLATDPHFFNLNMPVVAGDVTVPPGADVVDFGPLVIQGNLLLPSGSSLWAQGDLTVTGQIVMAPDSDVSCDGNLTAGEVDMVSPLGATPAPTPGTIEGQGRPLQGLTAISTRVYAQGSITLQNGVRHAVVTVPPPLLPEPVVTLGAVLRTFTAASDAGDYPGIYLLTLNGDIKLAQNPVAMVKGLVLSRGGNVDATNVGRLVGAAWAQNNVIAPQTQFRFYPYYTYVYDPRDSFSSGVGFMLGRESAVRTYRTASGWVVPSP